MKIREKIIESACIKDYEKFILIDEKYYGGYQRWLFTENLKTKFGVISTMVFKPMVQAGRVFKEEESLTMYISNDKNKLPIRLKASLAVGSLKADLDSYRGLKNTLNIKR